MHYWCGRKQTAAECLQCKMWRSNRLHRGTISGLLFYISVETNYHCYCANDPRLWLISALHVISCQENREHADSRWDNEDRKGGERATQSGFIVFTDTHTANVNVNILDKNKNVESMWRRRRRCASWTLTSLLMSAPASSSIWTMASSPRTQAYMRGVIPCEREGGRRRVTGFRLDYSFLQCHFVEKKARRSFSVQRKLNLLIWKWYTKKLYSAACYLCVA